MWSVRVKWEPRDLWVGVFWDRGWQYPTDWIREGHARHMLKFLPPDQVSGMARRLDVYVCLVPCLPIHFTWASVERGTP